MNEESKNFWRKPWKGWRGVFGWFVLLAGGVFISIFTISLATTINGGVMDLALPSSVVAILIALLLVLAILFIRWLCNWRNFRRFFFTVACVLTVIALFYAEENWRGKHAWQKYKREWEAKGEKFSVAEIAPPPVPDDQNFAMQPIWVEEVSGMMGMEKAKAWYGDRVAALGHTNLVRPLEMLVEFSSGKLSNTNYSQGNWQKAEKADLKKWQEYYRWLATVTNDVFHMEKPTRAADFFPVAAQPQTPAEDVLLALSRHNPTIEMLRAASKLPYARFPIGYTDDDPAEILLPHLAPMKGCSITLQLRTTAELQSGQTEKALDDAKLMLLLIESVRPEPILISHLVRIAMLNIAMQSVWEGLADHKWSNAQLAALETELGKLDFLADYEFCMHGERGFGAGSIDFLRRHRDQIDNISSYKFDEEKDVHSKLSFQIWLARFAPGGWFEQNKVACCRMNFELTYPIVNLKTRVVSPPDEKRESKMWDNFHPTPYNLFTGIMSPALGRCSERFAHAQSFTDEARIAIALERHRLAHGNFPETLDALAPQFMQKIPHDVIGGQPLKYHRTDGGQFILYSVGWNETDDGGKIALSKSGSSIDYKQGDWVWRYPEK